MYQKKQGTQKKNSINWPFKFKKSPRQRNWFKGIWSEWVAGLLLQIKGYQICERRYKTPLGEIDLIACKRKLIVAVEVKARATYHQGLESLTPRQMQRISRALEYYLSTHQNAAGSDCRFDVIVVKPWSWPRHVIHAWEA